MKFIGQMGSWGGHATASRRQDRSLHEKNSGFGKIGNSFFVTSWPGISRKCTLDLPVGHTSDKYLMHTYQASVRAQVQGRSHVIKTEVRAMIAQDAR